MRLFGQVGNFSIMSFSHADVFNRLYPDYIEKAHVYKDNIDKYGYTNWYDWRIDHWGTKWEVSNEDIAANEANEFLELEFDTAWSPPEGIYRALLDIIDENRLSASVVWFYDEPGMAMAGYL